MPLQCKKFSLFSRSFKNIKHHKEGTLGEKCVGNKNKNIIKTPNDESVDDTNNPFSSDNITKESEEPVQQEEAKMEEVKEDHNVHVESVSDKDKAAVGEDVTKPEDEKESNRTEVTIKNEPETEERREKIKRINVGQCGFDVKVEIYKEDMKAEENELEFQENEYFEPNEQKDIALHYVKSESFINNKAESDNTKVCLTMENIESVDSNEERDCQETKSFDMSIDTNKESDAELPPKNNDVTERVKSQIESPVPVTPKSCFCLFVGSVQI